MTENSKVFQDEPDNADDEQSITNDQPFTDHASPPREFTPYLNTVLIKCVRV